MALSSLSFKKLWLELFDTIFSNWESFIPLRNLKIENNFQHLNSMTFFVPFQFLQLKCKKWILSMNKFKTVPEITFN